ncbi:MAG: hypothetical protein WAP51_03235, partial [Candidatus Sungiibacteriota bacterium]
MRKALFVLALAMLVFLPLTAEAQWGAPGSFVYPEPQIGYPYGMPPVMYPAPPPVMYPAPPQVIYAPPPVMIQLPPARPPQVMVQMPQQPAVHAPRHHVLKSGGATIVTKCTDCTVTNTINNGKAVAQQSPEPRAATPSPSADSWLAIWLIVAAVVILVLSSILINQCMTRPRPVPPSPTPEPAPATPEPAPPARADNAVAEEGRHQFCDVPKARVHRRKC